jgi:hypothetical protein
MRHGEISNPANNLDNIEKNFEIKSMRRRIKWVEQ